MRKEEERERKDGGGVPSRLAIASSSIQECLRSPVR
jgi:hypothetical protein